LIKNLIAIVNLKALRYRTKLSPSICNEINKTTIDFEFLRQRKRPVKMTEITRHDQIIFVTQSTKDWRGPYITMN